MAISASTITASQTLEEFRLEYNKLQADVSSLKDSPTFASSISFEGATDDDYETTDIITEGKYFLYGQEVNDYHNLNQDMIYTVCVAAVQEIDRQQILDKIEINNLKTQYNDLLARVTALENN